MIQLPVFSPNNLQHSLIVGVFFGAWITLFFSERYGWVFSGLVVPGYLAPLLTFAPVDAAAIVVEASVAFVIVRAVGEGAWASRGYLPLFGRDRFLAIVVVSLAVRIVAESVVFPALSGRVA